MADVTALMVKELRESTGVGMMDAKKALVECDGNMNDSIDFLRKKGLSKAAKKAGRAAAEGLVSVKSSDDGKTAVVIEVNSETDFVARNDKFQDIVSDITKISIGIDDLDTLLNSDLSGKSVKENLTDMVATIGENMQLRRMAKLNVTNGVVASYIHGAIIPGMGKIGVLVALESDAPADDLLAIGKQIAMHVAATNPQFLSKEDVSSDVIDRERSVLREQALASGKPPEIVDKMIDGRMRKYYEEICLLEQVFVIDGETKVSDVVAKSGKDAGHDVKLTGYVRFELGDGVEKKVTDFAAEVAAAVNG